VLWSLGNETGLGRNLDAMYTAMKEIDPTRPIHYESRNPPYVHALSSFDVISTMYPTIDAIQDLMNQDPTRPVIICEYAHAMGNGLGNFKKYWDLYDTHPRLQGAFVWDWVDQALRHPGPGGRTLWNWVNTSDGANANDGLVNADRTPQPELHEARKVQQPVKIEAVDVGSGRIRVRNAYDFLGLAHLALDGKSSRTERPSVGLARGTRRCVGRRDRRCRSGGGIGNRQLLEESATCARPLGPRAGRGSSSRFRSAVGIRQPRRRRPRGHRVRGEDRGVGSRVQRHDRRRRRRARLVSLEGRGAAGRRPSTTPLARPNRPTKAGTASFAHRWRRPGWIVASVRPARPRLGRARMA
jgi:hypothetical protein